MNKIAAGTFAVSGLLWSITALFVGSWWESPAFGRMGLPLAVCGVLWAASSIVLLALWAGQTVKPSVLVAALAGYALPATLAGQSIIWFTLEENNVSAMGSAIAWLAVGGAAWFRLRIIAQQPHDGQEG